jgi:hypothetical protein
MWPHAVYARAKLAFGVLREFGRRTPGVTVADFHPGIIASDFGRYMGVRGAVLTRLAKPFLDRPVDGARRGWYTSRPPTRTSTAATSLTSALPQGHPCWTTATSPPRCESWLSECPQRMSR